MISHTTRREKKRPPQKRGDIVGNPSVVGHVKKTPVFVKRCSGGPHVKKPRSL